MSRGIFRGIMWFLLLAGIAIFAFGQFVNYQFQRDLINTKDWREISPSRARFLLNAIWQYDTPLFSPLTKDVNTLYRTEPGWNRDPADFQIPKPYSDFTDFVFGYQTPNGDVFSSPTMADENIPVARIRHNLHPKDAYQRDSDSLRSSVFTKTFQRYDTLFSNSMVVNWDKWHSALPLLIDLTLRNTTYDHWFDSTYVIRNNVMRNSQEHLVYIECKSGNNIVYAKGIDSLRNDPEWLAAERAIGDKDTVKVFSREVWENKTPLMRQGLLAISLIGFVLVIGSVIALSKL